MTATPTTNVADLQRVQTQMRSYGAAPTMQQIAQGVASGTSTPARRRTASGAMQVNVPPPANSYRTYTSRSGLYRLAVPSNWQVVEEGGTGVTIAPPGGVATGNGQTDIIYGVMVNHYDPFGNRGYGNATLQSATSDLLAAIQQSSPYLRLVSNNAQRVQMANGTALAAALRGVDPATGINERITVVARQLSDEHLLYVLFVTPENEVSRYNGVLNQVVNSIAVNPSQPH